MIRAGRAPPQALGSQARRTRPGLRPQRQPPGQGTIVTRAGGHNPAANLSAVKASREGFRSKVLAEMA